MNVCLRVVFELASLAIAKPLLGDEGDVQRWKASWIAGFATYAIVCHSIKICVGMKRDQVALTNNTEVCAFILKHILQFLIPLSHSLLAYAYLMGLDTKNHHMENNWKMVAFGIRIFTLVVGSLLALMGACKICNLAANDQYQIIAIQRNVENQSVANVSGLGQRDEENQSFAPEEIQLDVDDHSYPDARLSHWDVETRLLADANVSEESQRDEENQSFANENVSEEVQRDVESRSYFMDVTQWPVCHPSTSEFTPHVVMDFYDFSDTDDLKKLHWDVDKQFYADATVLEEVQRCGEPNICRCKCIGTDSRESIIWRCKCVADEANVLQMRMYQSGLPDRRKCMCVIISK